jgi:hypothetical protein
VGIRVVDSRCAGYEGKLSLKGYWGVCASQGLRHQGVKVLSVAIG